MNQGGNQKNNSEKSKQEIIPTQHLNFADIQSEQSAKSMESLFTPPVDIRHRGFTGSHSIKKPVFNTQNLLSSNEIGEIHEMSSENIGSQQLLWGTNISINEISSKFRRFLTEFRLPEDTHQQTFYIRQILEIKETQVFILNIDGRHLNSFDRSLYLQMINYPTEMIPIMDIVANQLYCECNSMNLEKPNTNVQVRIVGLANQSRIRDLGPNDIDKLISITGLTIRAGDIIPEMRDAFFKCSICGKTENTLLQRSRITEPLECKNCRSKYSFELIHNRSSYLDKQHVKLQETPEHMPEGETPLTLQLCCYDELVDFVKPGDRCEIVGIFRAQGLRINPRMRTLQSIYRTYVDVVSFTKFNKKKLNLEEQEEEQLSHNELNQEYNETMKREIEILSKNPDIYNILVDSFAPSIWENEDVKKGLLLQVFGGVSKDFSSSGRGKFRGDLNVLLIGDPSTAKSQLLQYVHNLAPRGIYTSGKGSSVVGLTAYVTKDPETKDIVIESGALVLSDRGICCIDEFDKMDDNTKVILHEAMEQQTISIAKAGIICQLNARTAILAAANPVGSKYNPKMSVVKNLQLPPTLLSRFDLIYLMLDKRNEASDRRLANHIVSLYGKEEDDIKEVQNKYLPKELLTAYINHARKRSPIMSETAMKDLIDNYLKMREVGISKNTISATPRQLESLIRLSEARAKLRFADFVERDDVEEAIRLIKVATQQAATNPETGVIDMDLIATGMTSASRQKLTQLADTIKNILREHESAARKGVKFSSVGEEVKKKIDSMGSQAFIFSEYELRNALRQLEDEGIISLLGNKKVPTIRLIGFQLQ